MGDLARRTTLGVVLAVTTALAVSGVAQADFAGAGSLATGRYNHTATLLNDGRVLVAGGNNGGSLAGAQLYDPKLNAWSSAASMHIARSGDGAVVLHSGKVLVAGGYAPGSDGSSDSGYSRTAELYDPETDTWSRAGDMSTARFQATMTVLPDGRVLVAGGTGDIDTGAGVQDAVALDSAEVYDPATDGWSDVPSMSAARSRATATLLSNGTVLVAGGYENGTGELNSAELFDPETNTWSPTGSLAQARDSATATALPDGDVLVAGGDSGRGSALSGAELYDPAAGTWHDAANMHHARQTAASALLKDGTVLVSGGEDARLGNVLDTVERYDPAADKWTEAGTMPVALKQHTITALGDGRALVVGGNPGGFNRGLNAVERFSTVTASLTDASFGSWLIGSPSGVVKSVLTNTGDGPLDVQDVSVRGIDANDFSIVSNTCLSTLMPGSTCEVGMKLTPSAEGSLSAALIVTDGSTAVGSTTALLNGTGRKPASPTPGPGTGGTTTGGTTPGGTTNGGTTTGGTTTGGTSGSAPLPGSAPSLDGSISAHSAARATCRVRKSARKRSTVTCRLRLPTKATMALNARLLKGTKVLARKRTTARAGRVKVTLRVNRRLRSGRYTLAVSRRDGTSVLRQRIRAS